MKIKSILCEIEGHTGPVPVPFDVFAQHFSEDVQSNWGYWPESYIEKLKSWEPHEPWNPPTFFRLADGSLIETTKDNGHDVDVKTLGGNSP